MPNVKKPFRLRRFPTGAFTLAELIVVVTILAILATIGFLALSGYSSDASNSAVRTNVRILSESVSSESLQGGNSLRRYVIHQSGSALSWATLLGQVLVGGQYGMPGTNYSAGIADFATLRVNPSKFKSAFLGTSVTSAAFAAAGDPFFLAAADITETLASGKIRTRSFHQTVGYVGSGAIVEGDFPVGTTNSSPGLLADSLGNPIVDSSKPSQYPGCDTPDIALSNWQVWAACNVGASNAYSGQPIALSDTWVSGGPNGAQKSYMGAYFQWGRNDDVTTGATGSVAAAWTLAGTVGHSNFIPTPASPYDWLATQNDNLWGWQWTWTGTGTFYSQGMPLAMRWPCMAGYHVPTHLEWCNAIMSADPTVTSCIDGVWTGTTATATVLKLPLSGYRRYNTAVFESQGTAGYYWASSVYSWRNVCAATFGSVAGAGVRTGFCGSRPSGYSVRCVKN